MLKSDWLVTYFSGTTKSIRMPRSNLRALSNLTENTERDGSRSGNNKNQSANGRNAQNGTSRGHAVSQGESRQNNQSPPESRRNSQNQAASRHTGQSQVELGQRSTNQVTGRETPARSTSLRETLDGSQYRHSDMSQRSPAISRTPSADRRLLRTLTVSPNADEINEYDDPTPASAYTPKQTQSRQGGSHYSTNRTPTGTPNRNSMSRTPSENGGGRVTVQIPETSDTRGVSCMRYSFKNAFIYTRLLCHFLDFIHFLTLGVLIIVTKN